MNQSLYADILNDCHEKLSVHYHSLVKKLANELEIKLEDNDWLDHNNLSQLVKELTQKNQEANRRYSRMLIEVDRIEDDSQVENILKKYIAEESVGYYRNLAKKELDEL